jgi:hypothetical protein
MASPATSEATRPAMASQHDASSLRAMRASTRTISKAVQAAMVIGAVARRS